MHIIKIDGFIPTIRNKYFVLLYYLNICHCFKRKKFYKLQWHSHLESLRTSESDYLKKLSTNDKMNIFVFNCNMVKFNEIKQP